jgi:hypothetical protein
MERTNGKKKHFIWIHNFARDMKEKNNCLYTRDDRGNTGTLTGNGVQNFVPLCQRYKKNMAKRKKKIMQGYTAIAKDFIGWRLHNFAREKEKKWQN